MALVVRTNPSQVTDVVIGDLGDIRIPASGGSETFTTEHEIQGVRESYDLRTLLLDDAHGAGSSTLQLMDGASPVSQTNIEAFIDMSVISATGPYSFVTRGASSVVTVDDYTIYVKADGTRPFAAPVAGVAPTLPAHLSTRQWVLDQIVSGSITAAAHKTLRQLIHFIDEGPAEGFLSGAYKEVTGTLFPTSIIWYTDSGKTEKIVEKTITRSGGGATNLLPTPIVWKVYDIDGSTVLATISDAITYSGVSVASVTRTIT